VLYHTFVWLHIITLLLLWISIIGLYQFWFKLCLRHIFCRDVVDMYVGLYAWIVIIVMYVCRIILELLKRREKSKKELLKLTVEVAEKR